MRQLATLPTADAARTFADHLQTLRIEAKVEQLPDGWAVWVCDEDRLPQARQELAEFTSNPGDKRFAAARQTAEAARRRLEKEEEEYAAHAPVRPAAPSGPTRPAPWTYGMILTCVLVFVAHTGYLIYQNGGLASPNTVNILLGQTTGLVEPTSPAQQALSIASFDVVRDGGIGWNGLLDVQYGQVWRLVTPIFLHFGLIHLLFNMTMFRQLGAAVEERRGAWRFLLLVLAIAVASNLAQYYLDVTSKAGTLIVQRNPLFGGMSGVLYGLFGYVWMKSRYEPALGLEVSPRLVFWLIGWLFLCMTGAIGPVANTAHVAGLLVGVVIGAAPHVWRLARGRPAR